MTIFASLLFLGGLAGHFPDTAFAANNEKKPASKVGPSGLAVPRFESLSSTKVNLRAGPGLRYPISWVYLRRGMPVLVTAEFEYWRKIKDVDGAEGWLHKSLIRGRRTAIVVGETRDLRANPTDSAPIVAKAEAGVLARLLACKGKWCQLEANDLRGWVLREQFFGALPNEVFD